MHRHLLAPVLQRGGHYAGAVAAPDSGLWHRDTDHLPAAASPRGGDARGQDARIPGSRLALPGDPGRPRVTAMSDEWRGVFYSPVVGRRGVVVPALVGGTAGVSP